MEKSIGQCAFILRDEDIQFLLISDTANVFCENETYGHPNNSLHTTLLIGACTLHPISSLFGRCCILLSFTIPIVAFGVISLSSSFLLFSSLFLGLEDIFLRLFKGYRRYWKIHSGPSFPVPFSFEVAF